MWQHRNLDAEPRRPGAFAEGLGARHCEGSSPSIRHSSGLGRQCCCLYLNASPHLIKPCAEQSVCLCLTLL